MTTVEHPGVDGARTCVVFSWLRGRPLGDDAGSDDYRRLGTVAARLHDRAERWTVPAGFSPMVWDRVFYYPTEPVVLYEDRFRALMTRERESGGVCRRREGGGRVEEAAPGAADHGPPR